MYSVQGNFISMYQFFLNYQNYIYPKPKQYPVIYYLNYQNYNYISQNIKTMRCVNILNYLKTKNNYRKLTK